MSNRNGFILAFGLVALGAASVQADEIARRRSNDDRYGNNGGVYTNDGYYDDDDYYDYGDNRGNGNGRAGTMNNRLRGMDGNNDGRITRSEWRGNENAFSRRDRNGDGVLAGRELRRNNNGNRNRVDDTRIDSMGSIDTNRDGAVSRGEWRGNRGEFDRLDRNRDGYLTSSETRGQAVRY